MRIWCVCVCVEKCLAFASLVYFAFHLCITQFHIYNTSNTIKKKKKKNTQEKSAAGKNHVYVYMCCVCVFVCVAFNDANFVSFFLIAVSFAFTLLDFFFLNALKIY